MGALGSVAALSLGRSSLEGPLPDTVLASLAEPITNDVRDGKRVGRSHRHEADNDAETAQAGNEITNTDLR